MRMAEAMRREDINVSNCSLHGRNIENKSLINKTTKLVDELS